MQQIQNYQKRYNNVVNAGANSIQKMVSSLESTIRGLPIIGDFIADAISFDDIKNSDEITLMIKSLSVEPNAQQQAQPAAKSVTAIPSWIKNNAEWWADGVIDDSSFLQGIQFLINEGIMVIPPTETSGSSDSQGVPAWVKNNAGWWADGTIDDNSFVSGIQYLVKVGIIKVG